MKEEEVGSVALPKGTRVRLRSGGFLGSVHSTAWKYQNMTGEIAGSIAVAGYLVRSWQVEGDAPLQTLHLYRVRLDTGVEVEYLTEDCLERLAEMGG